MHVMSALEYSAIVRELAPKITGRHFGRIRKLGEGIYRLKIGTAEILCELGARLHETRYIGAAEATDQFSEKAAKELDNAKLLALGQPGGDRVIAFEFDKGTLIFEMFGNGNAILARGGKTICAAKYEKWAGREIAAGKPYSLPPGAPSAIPELSEKYVIVSLMKLPLGREYALEALARAGIGEKRPGSSLTKEEASRLEAELAAVRSSASPAAFYGADGKPADFALFPLSRHSELKTRNFATLSEAADEYYQNAVRPDPVMEKLLRRLEKQQERLEALKGEEAAFRRTGDYVYAHYQEIERLLELARAGRFGEMEKLAGKKPEKIDKKERSFEIGLE